MTNNLAGSTREFHIKIMGRMLEHLGVQMYKRRDIAIAELVANSWDAGAKRVDVNIPVEGNYDRKKSVLTLIDNGVGMSEDQVEGEYLVVGRNRRENDNSGLPDRPVMGRKGIGKLAGFGVASTMSLTTWKDGISTTITLDINSLKAPAGEVTDVAIIGQISPITQDEMSSCGTKVVLSDLKHKTPLAINKLRESLSRRFSRKVLGQMEIYVNGELIGEPNIELSERVPEEGMLENTLPDGSKVRYYYGFAAKNITTREMQGFTIHVRGKTAQAPPYFFGVESTASGLHYARYMTGEVEADFLDDGEDDESDLISTDRQEIDWAHERTQELLEWGQGLTRKALRTKAEKKGKELEQEVMQLDSLRERIEKLDPASQRQVSGFLRKLGEADTAPERTQDLASSLVRAFEYQHFHDVVDQIESVSEYPGQLQALLMYLADWKVLESRAILEIIKGRIEVIRKFHFMIVNNAPETASKKSPDNMHDLVAGYPWLLKPEWQVFAEEKWLSTQLKEWNAEDIEDEDERLRYDFLALGDDKRLAIIEIKRAHHAVEIDELQRLVKYRERLSKAHERDLYMVMICGGNLNISSSEEEVWKSRPDGEIRTWAEIHDKTKSYYEHYRALLEGDIEHSDFANKEREIAQTRNVLQRGSTKRDSRTRKSGFGPQD